MTVIESRKTPGPGTARTVIGIDPGQRGGIAAILPGDQIIAIPMPISRDRHPDIHTIQGWLATCRVRGLDMVAVFIEEPMKVFQRFDRRTGKLQVRSDMSVLHSFVGQLIAVCRINGIEPVLVQSKRWQKVILNTAKPKGKLSCEYVTRRFPQVNLFPSTRYRKPHDGMADAVCIALWGMIQEGRML